MTLKLPSQAALQRSAEHENNKLSLAQYAEIAQIPLVLLQTVKQIHSDKIITYAGGTPQTPPEADGVIISGGLGYGGVFVADCLALLLFSPKGNLCAAVHAGWRGALQRIAGKTVYMIREMGVMAEELRAVLAAGISVEHYRVGEELLPLFAAQAHDADAIFIAYDDGWHLDLRQTVAQDLVGSGVDPNHIYDSGLCSFRDCSLLWSFRREGKKALRNMVFCGWHSDHPF